jgi:hypothetical protein
MTIEDEPQEPADDGAPITADELIRAATRLVMGSAGIAVASASRWQRGAEAAAASGAAGSLASAALGLGLAAERVVVKGASVVGGTAASVTWGVMRATPFRRPAERLAERFRGEQRLSEREVTDAADAIVDAIGEAVLARIDIDRVIDRIALERVLARMDRRELARRVDERSTEEGATG